MRQRFWLAPVIVFVVALAVYLRTAPPGLTWAHDSADGGDLIAAALVRGVPHPSGYPTFILLAHLFTRLPWHTPAWQVTLISMLSGAAAAALTAATVQHVAVQTGDTAVSVLASGHPSDEGTGEPAMVWRSSSVSSLLFATPAIIAGLALAFSPLFWGQAIVAEVYALNACLAALVIWALVRWRYGASSMWAVVAGVAFGAALGNHLTSIWLTPFVAICLILPSAQSARRVRSVANFLLATGVGLLVYVYLPLAAAADPPVNWGDPQSGEGFWWVVSGQLYRSFVLAVGWPEALGRLSAWSGLLWREFLPWGVVLALAGLAWLFLADRFIALGMIVSLALGLSWAIGYDTTDSLLTLLPGWVMISLWIGLGMVWLLNLLQRIGTRAALITGVVALTLLAVPLTLNWTALDLSKDREAENFLDAVMQIAEPDAMVVTVGDRATFALWYARYGLQRRTDIIPVSRDLWALESYRRTVGATHPALAGREPPSELATLVSSSLRQKRTVYLAQASMTPVDLAEPPLPQGSQSRLRQEALVLPSNTSAGWVLWKLEPPP